VVSTRCSFLAPTRPTVRAVVSTRRSFLAPTRPTAEGSRPLDRRLKLAPSRVTPTQAGVSRAKVQELARTLAGRSAKVCSHHAVTCAELVKPPSKIVT
jgi:hypothetical protein